MDVRSLARKTALIADAGNRVVAPVAFEAWAAYYAKRFAPWLVRALGRWQARVGIPGAQ